MEFPIKLDTAVEAGWSIVYNEGSLVIIFLMSFIQKMDFVLTNSEDVDEMQHFIWVLTVCKSTHLEFLVFKGLKT